MNNKGELANMGPLILAAVAIIIGVAIFSGSVSPTVGTMTQTRTLVNGSYTVPAAGAYLDLIGQEYISGVILVNATNSSATVPASNYSIVEMNSPTTGVKTVRLYSAGGSYASRPVNVTYTYGDVGYVDDAGGRAAVNLIPIGVALALLAAALFATNIRDLFD